jgi:hypothetical protein
MTGDCHVRFCERLAGATPACLLGGENCCTRNHLVCAEILPQRTQRIRNERKEVATKEIGSIKVKLTLIAVINSSAYICGKICANLRETSGALKMLKVQVPFPQIFADYYADGRRLFFSNQFSTLRSLLSTSQFLRAPLPTFCSLLTINYYSLPLKSKHSFLVELPSIYKCNSR